MQDLATQTLLALEQRLDRLHFLLHGDDATANAVASSNPSPSVASRLHSLEKSLQTIAAQSTSAAELLSIQKQHPDIWDEPVEREDVDTVPEDALAALVLAHMPSYHTTAAQLTSLNDLPIPDAASSAAFASLGPRIQRVRQRQEQQADMINFLREQSAAVVGRWYELGIVSMGDCWSEWDARLMQAERSVRQAEGRKKREDEAV